MIVCPACGQETPEGFPRCAHCGAELAAATAAPREERKIVTVLFCDLVGSTARAEGADPEDVRAALSRYHERVRSELERRGGTVEKFIGDAVMALFGAPTAHEDDPERAVRAAIAIRDWAREEGELEVRVGITTGEALITLGARPEAGEGMASGDVVNTGSRLESAAPTNGILVDESTYRATEHVFDHREADSVEAKGKAEPVRVWEPVEATAIAGVELRPETPLVGRERERVLLFEALERVQRESSPQLVTLVGVPGIGKSRLVAELYAEIDRREELTHWRHGRSLPYGERVAFWAFAEMVKAQAGVLASDTREMVAAKLREAVASLIEGDDADWLERRLQPLLGLGDASEDRDQSFGSWRRFVEALAEQRPTVLVFEDLHWADDDLLDFVDYLVDWSEGVPLLVVGTARPELLDRRPGWGGGKLNALTLSLSPLDDTETAKLISSLLERSVLPAETQEALLQRAGGNPLYAEQFARMLAERGDVGDLPETVQGIIAARLDGLSAEEKALLQDASVIGRAFWPGALEVVAGTAPAEAETLLHSLARKEFVRRERRSAVEGETEYAFAHLLVRDVAYSQIPRARRTERHLAAAAWIESLGRTEDRAELLVHHYLAALELTRAARGDVSEFADRAIEALLAAARRSRTLFAFGQAERYAREALELAGEDDPRRPEILLELAPAEAELGKEESLGHFEQAVQAFAARGDVERAAEAENMAAFWLWNFGRGDEAHAATARALTLVRDRPLSGAKIHAMANRARLLMLASELPEAVEIGTEALALAQALGDEEAQAGLLITVGTAHNQLEGSGTEEIERGIEIAERLNLETHFNRGHNNLGQVSWERGDLAGALRRHELLLESAERFGSVQWFLWNLPMVGSIEYMRGNWSRADEFFARYRALVATTPGHILDGLVDLIQAKKATACGAPDAAQRWERALESGRQQKSPMMLGPSLLGKARFELAEGRRDAAEALIDEALALHNYYTAFIDVGWLLHDLGRPDEMPDTNTASVWAEAGALIARGELDAAVEGLARTDLKLEEMYARLRTGDESNVRQALEFYRSVGATRYIREGETMLAATA